MRGGSKNPCNPNPLNIFYVYFYKSGRDPSKMTVCNLNFFGIEVPLAGSRPTKIYVSCVTRFEQGRIKGGPGGTGPP